MRPVCLAVIVGFGATVALQAQTILLDNFSGGGATGILAGTTWAGPGNVVLNGTTITVGNTALNDNGWGTHSATINATGMNLITIVAQQDVGNASPFLVLGFLDSDLHSEVFSVSAFSFTMGAPTTVQIPISSWGTVNPANITEWSIGGGTAGVVDFRMTFDNLTLSASAVPEPGTHAVLAGVLALGFATWRRRRAGLRRV